MNTKQHCCNLSAHTLMLTLVCFFMLALRSFCAESTAAPKLAVATSFVVVTNVVVVTNYVVITNVALSTNAFTAGPDASTLQHSNVSPAQPELGPAGGRL